MAPHDFNYRINGIQLIATAGVSDVRLNEGIAGKRAEMIEVAYRHGVYVADRHWSKARLMRLDVYLPGGTPSEIYTVKDEIEFLLADGINTITRNHPVAVGHLLLAHYDEALAGLADVEQPDGPDRFIWQWPVWQLRGYWEEPTASVDNTDSTLGASATLTSFGVSGSHATEPVFTITCDADGANPAIEDPVTLDKLTAAASFVASDVITIDVPNQTFSKNGTRAKNLVSVNRGHMMEFAARRSGIALDFTSDTGTWTVRTQVKNRWRG